MYKWRFFMTKYQIVEELGKKKVVEKIARHYKTFAREDLCQYVYLYLLEKVDEDKLIELYNTNKLKQYLAGIVHRQALSNHSEYIKTYKQVGLSIENEDELEHPRADKLVYRDENPHQLEDDVDAYIKTLKPSEQSMIWLFAIPFGDRMEDIKIWCKENGYSYHSYQNLSSALKNKVRKNYGKTAPPRKPYTRSTKVKFTDADGTVKIYNCRLDCVRELKETRGYYPDCIYKCLVGKRNSYKGCKFEYVD